jgi:hypothetical protein
MPKASRWIVALQALAVSFVVAPAQAQMPELAPFGGFQFGGSFATPAGVPVSLHDSFDYGGTFDVPIAESWRLGLLYSRQSTDLRGQGSSFDVTVERWLASAVEEQGEGKVRFFGEALVGITRFVPGLNGVGSDVRFTGGVGLGVKRFLSDKLGVRAQARVFYVFSQASSGAFCNNGNCLFLFSGSGLWQGEVSAGVVIGF